MRIAVQTGREAVVATCRAVERFGEEVSPRGELTREIVPFTLEIADPNLDDALATRIGKDDFRPRLAVAEAWHLAEGVPYGDRIRALTADLDSRRWDRAELSYGVRLHNQLPTILRALLEDPETRQAVGLIWRPDDLISGDASYLCGTQVQFLLRRGALRMIVTMRSNDAWHGLPYNLYAFAYLQRNLAHELGVEQGAYTHQVGSMHLYERHWEKAAALRMPS